MGDWSTKLWQSCLKKKGRRNDYFRVSLPLLFSKVVVITTFSTIRYEYTYVLRYSSLDEVCKGERWLRRYRSSNYQLLVKGTLSSNERSASSSQLKIIRYDISNCSISMIGTMCIENNTNCRSPVVQSLLYKLGTSKLQTLESLELREMETVYIFRRRF